MNARLPVNSAWVWFLATGMAALADTISWTAGGGTDTNWSNTSNWSHAGDPAGHDATFETNGWKTSGDTSVCDADKPLNSLYYRFSTPGTTTTNHQTRIPAGVTLTLSNTVSTTTNLWVAAVTTGQYTRVYMTGGGTLQLLAGRCVVGNYYTTMTDSDRARLDLTGLSEFRMTGEAFIVGGRSPGGGGQGIRGWVELAATNTIVTPRMDVGTASDTGDGGGAGTLLLGQSNTIWATTQLIGYSKGHGRIAFRSGLSSPTLTIRGTSGGTSRANLTLGYSSGSGTGGFGTNDFTGGVVDALYTNISIGSIALTYIAHGLLTFDGGTIDAFTTTLGGGGGAGSGTGRLAIGGTGVFTVNTLTLGNRTGSGTITGAVDLNGGTLRAVTITNGAGTATRSIQFQGGTLANKPGSNLTVHATVPITLSTATGHVFDVEATRTGTVNCAIGESGASVGPVVKTGGGVLSLSGDNAFTGGLIVSNGTAIVNGSMTNTRVTVAAGALQGTGTFRFNIDGANADSGIVCRAGTVDLSGFTLAFAAQSASAGAYTIVTNAGGTLSGAFASVLDQPVGYTVTNIANTSVLLVPAAAVPVVITVQSNQSYATGNTLTLTWDTDLEVSGWVAYRVAGSGNDYALTPATVEGTHHTRTIAGLTELTDYDVVIWSSASSLAYPLTTLIADPATGDTTWSGAATTNSADWRWRRGGNWSLGQPPSPSSLATFNQAGLENTNAAGDTCVLDTDASVGAVRFAHTNASLAHQIRVPAGSALTVCKAGTALEVSGAGGLTRACLVGDGTWRVTNSSATVFIGNVSAGGNDSSPETVADVARLDLSGLRSFEANASELQIGFGDNLYGRVVGAATNTLTLGALRVAASSGGSGGFGALNLGLANTLNVGSMVVASSKGRGWLRFAQTNAGATAVIRGSSGGSSRATLTVGSSGGNAGPNAYGNVDFSGGAVDALFGTISLGASALANPGYGYLTVDAGVLDVTTINAGSSSSGGGAYGILTVRGTAQVSIGRLSLGSNPGSSGTVNLQGGTLNVAVFTNGSGTRLFNWAGGTLTATACYLGSVTQNHATATLSPGLTAIATNTFAGNYVLAAGQWELDADVAACACDRVDVGGLLDLSGNADTLSIRLPSGPLKRPIIIATYGTLLGAFDTRHGFSGFVDYHYQGGNQIAIGPPPGSVFTFR